MKKQVTVIDPNTGKTVTVEVDMSPEEEAALKATWDKEEE